MCDRLTGVNLKTAFYQLQPWKIVRNDIRLKHDLVMELFCYKYQPNSQ